MDTVALAQIAPVVTLSNVTHWGELASDIADLLAPHLMAHYPSWRFGCAKPDPRAVQTVVRLHDVHPSQLLHVGDSLDHGVRGALAAGAWGAWALWITPHTPA